MTAARALVALPFPELERDELVERRPRGRPRSGEALIDSTTPWEYDRRAQYVVRHHPEGLTLAEVGQLLGISRERVRQIEERALRKLRRQAEAAGSSAHEVLELLTPPGNSVGGSKAQGSRASAPTSVAKNAR